MLLVISKATNHIFMG